MSPYPTCPYCNQSMVRAHEKDDQGSGWRVVWLCACEPDPQVVARNEKRIQFLHDAGTKITIRRTEQWRTS